MTAPALFTDHSLTEDSTVDFAPRRRWPTSVLVLAASGLAARCAAWLLAGAPVLADADAARLLIGVGLASGVVLVLLAYSFVRNVCDQAEPAWAHLAGVSAAAVTAFWPTQFDTTALGSGWSILGLLLLMASAFWARGNTVLSRLGFCGSMLAAVCLAPVTASVFIVAIAAVLLGKGPRIFTRIRDLVLLVASAALAVWLLWLRGADGPVALGQVAIDPQAWGTGLLGWAKTLSSPWAMSPAAEGWLGAIRLVAGVLLAAGALIGILATWSRHRMSPTLLAILGSAALASLASNAPEPAWRYGVEPVLLPWVGIFLAKMMGARVLPKQRPPIVVKFLAHRRSNGGG